MAGLVGCYSGRQQSWRGRRSWEKGYRGQGLPSREDWLRTTNIFPRVQVCTSSGVHVPPGQTKDTASTSAPRRVVADNRLRTPPKLTDPAPRWVVSDNRLRILPKLTDPAPRWVVSDNRLRILPKLTDPAPRWVFPEGRMFHRALGNSNSHQPWQPGSSVAAVPLHLPPSSASESGQPALAAGWPAGLPTVPAPSESSPGRPPGSS